MCLSAVLGGLRAERTSAPRPGLTKVRTSLENSGLSPEYDFGIAWRSSFLSKAWFGCSNGLAGVHLRP